jgi:hypothetical protein
LLVFDFKGELLDVVAENLDLQSAVKLERRLNRLRTAKEREEEVYVVEEE